MNAAGGHCSQVQLRGDYNGTQTSRTDGAHEDSLSPRLWFDCIMVVSQSVFEMTQRSRTDNFGAVQSTAQLSRQRSMIKVAAALKLAALKLWICRRC